MIKHHPLVSVAMPVYNAEKYIRPAMDSLLNQTYKNFELIIINDGSSDRSKEIIHSYSDPRIRYFENPVNLGISKTRNKCIQRANGKYIAVLDNDDIALPDRLEKQVEFLESNDGYGVCGSFYDIIDGGGQVICKMKLPVTNKEIKTYLLFDNCFCNSSVMILSEILKEGLYSEGFDMIEDYYFLYSISKFKKLAILPQVLTQYRMHGKNTSIEKLGGMRSVRKKMDGLVLRDLGIPVSSTEFDLHTNFATVNFDYFKDPVRLKQLELWLIKLYQYLATSKEYDKRIIEKIMIRRWILIFSHTKYISHRLIFNKLILKFNLKYIGYFLELLKEKHSKQRTAA